MDTIGDMLTIIRNALGAGKRQCRITYSNIKWGVAKILEKQGRIKKAEKESEKEKKYIKISLDYLGGNPKIETIKRISKPGRRLYTKADEIYPPEFGFRIISTSKGVMTDKQAKKENVGGEIICRVR